VGAGSCLDTHDFDTSPGTAILVSECQRLNNQQWTVPADGAVVGVGGVGSSLRVAPEEAGSR
jgi:hypothetical protein